MCKIYYEEKYPIRISCSDSSFKGYFKLINVCKDKHYGNNYSQLLMDDINSNAGWDWEAMISAN